MNYDFSSLAGARVLVTGATGFTGGHLARRLLEQGAKLTVLARPSSKAGLVEDLKARGASVVLGDVTDESRVNEAVHGQEYVFHLAALFRQAKFPDQAYFDVNVKGTGNVLEAAKKAGVKRVVHCSTNGVHGSITNPPANEDYPFGPGDVYQVSKLEGEKLVMSMVSSGQIDAAVIRPAMIWGEGDRRIFKMFKGVAQRRFPIIGTGRVWMHWLYIEDLIDGFLLAAVKPQAKGRVYLLAGKRPVTLNYTVETIARIAGVKPLPFKIPAWPVQMLGSVVEKLCQPLGIEPPIYRRRVDFFVKNRCFDVSRAREELGFTPRYEFEEEAERIFTWYKNNAWF